MTTPTPTPMTLTEYANALRGGDRSLFLGELVWFSVTEASGMHHAALLAELTKVGLDKFAPRVPRDDDVFRRTCSGHQRKHVPTANDNVFENYLIRDVARRGGKVIKHIVVEAVDGNNKRLDYTAAISLEFDTATGQITIDALSAQPDDQVMNVAELIEQDFQRDKGRVNSYGIRDLFRSVLNMAGATSVRPGGGVYFVPQPKISLVEALEKLSDAIAGVETQTVPLIDNRRQREMVRKAVEAETTGEIDKTLAEIDQIMSGPEITAERFMAMSLRMNELKTRTKDYAELLDEELGNTDFRLSVLDAKIRQLYNHTK